MSSFSLVLPGAIARGAYEAGVIDVLVEKDVQVHRIVATSSGALNGLALAAAIRSGHKRQMVDALIESWIENGRWQGSLSISPLSLIRGRGLSKRDALIGMMRDLIKPCHSAHRQPIELRLIIAPLNGVMGKIGHDQATTYEKVLRFANEDFDTQESLEHMFQCVAAACAFPGLFEPVDLPGLGDCIDGGTVNNAPIKYALESSVLNRVLVVVPFPRVMLEGNWKKGWGLLNHLIEILINERLYRDLKESATVNEKMERLEGLCKAGVLNPYQLAAVKDALRVRKAEITQIRPREGLRPSPFAGFFDKRERLRLIDEGRAAAREMLKQLPAENPHAEQTT